MSRPASTFRQSDLTRAVKAARAVGLDVAETVIGADGSIRLIYRDTAGTMPSDPFDRWKANRDAR